MWILRGEGKRGRPNLQALYFGQRQCLPHFYPNGEISVLQNAVRSEPQERNRHRFWATISELDGRYLRVVTLEDRVTIHNAFPDRRFKP